MLAECFYNEVRDLSYDDAEPCDYLLPRDSHSQQPEARVA